MNSPFRFDRRAGRKLLLSLSTLACAVHSALVGAQQLPAPPDTSLWKCEACPADTGTTGYVDVGILGANGTDDQFGTYSGLHRDDPYLLLDGLVRYRGSDAEYFDLDGSLFNVDGQRIAALAPYLFLEGGKQGSIELKGSYEEIPYYPYSGALTPFLGVGSSPLTLPANWVVASSTQQMTALPGSLRETNLRQKRQIADLGGRWLPDQSHWTLDLNYRHDKEGGEKVSGANFLTTTSLLAVPVNYSTDQVDAGAQYTRDNWQVRLGYYGSFFHNGDATITWDNPFTPFGAGANVGRMSAAPDNSFNQFSLSGGWQIVPSTRLMGSFAFGEASQNDTYMPSTINPGITTQPLPRSNLDGSIDTYNYTVRLTSRPIDRLSITADWVDDRRDNKTAQAAYPQVVTDVFVASTVFNLPYSFDRTTARVIAGPCGSKRGEGGIWRQGSTLRHHVSIRGENRHIRRVAGIPHFDVEQVWLFAQVRSLASDNRRVPDRADGDRRRKSAAAAIRSRGPHTRRAARNRVLRAGAEPLARLVGRTPRGRLRPIPGRPDRGA
jgi:hypothetical protein